MRETAAVLFCVFGLLFGACKDQGRPAPASAPVELKSEDDKIIYALGLMLARNLGPFQLSPAEVEIVKAGLTDAMTGKPPRVELHQYGPKFQELARKRSEKQSAAEKAGAQEYLAKAAKEPGATKTASGLIYRTLKEGKGPSPKETDVVKVHYHGTLTSGKVFDSSRRRGEPAEFPLNRVIPCWTEGVQKMKVGETAQLVCPSEIAYGDRGSPPDIPGGATLIFEVELLEIKKPAEKPGEPALPK